MGRIRIARFVPLAVFLALLLHPEPSPADPVQQEIVEQDASFWRDTRQQGEVSLIQHEQVLLVAALAELYAASHDGEFPGSVAELMGVWPGGALVNLFTLQPTEPGLGSASSPGQIGYNPIMDGTGTAMGATITAFGKTATTRAYSVGVD